MFEYFILFILWLCFWSFSTVLISRWHSGKWWIMMGRSECPHCNHTLTAVELIPLLSWIIQLWRCKNCKTPIPPYYPISELLAGCIFVLMGWIANNFWYSLSDFMTWVFVFWWFTTIVYIIYDIRYMEIPDQIMVPWILITLVLIGICFLGSEYQIFYDYSKYPTFHTFFTDHIYAAIIIYSFFFLQILIPGWIHLIVNRDYKNFLWLVLSYFLFPIIMVTEFFLPKKSSRVEEKEIPAWIGWGDLRIALFIWLTLGTVHTISSLIIAYLVWWLVWIFILIKAKIYWEKSQHEIAFWPFLWIWWFISLILYVPILEYLQILYT